MLNISDNTFKEKEEIKNLSSFKLLVTRTNSRTLIKTLYFLGGILFVLLFMPWTQNIRSNAKVTALDANNKGVIENALKKFFSPEFLNRIDDVVVFNSLSKEDISKILTISIKKLLQRIEQVGFNIKLTDAAKEFIAEKGFDSEFGARPLNRAIQKYLEDPLAEEILKSSLQEGDSISVDLDKKTNELKFKNTKAKKSTSKEKDSEK